jgi:hypothetical protein
MDTPKPSGEHPNRIKRCCKCRLAKAGQSGSIVTGRRNSYVIQNKQSQICGFGCCPERNGKFHSQDTKRGTPTSGVPENVPVRAFPCPFWGVSRSRPFFCGKRGAHKKRNMKNIRDAVGWFCNVISVGCRAVIHKALLLVIFIALFVPPSAKATITREQAIAYVQNTWGIVDLSSDVISQTLDTSYSGVPYSDWIDFLVNSPTIFQPLSSGDYSTAAKNAYNYATGAAFTELISESGLTGVAAPAELAAWPIQQAIGSFYNAVADASFNKQMQFYFAARSAGNTMNQIINMQDYDVILADTSFLPTSSTLTKMALQVVVWVDFETKSDLQALFTGK